VFDVAAQLSMLAAMTASPSFSITRHCIQQLLHAAMQTDAQSPSRPCSGILTGADHTLNRMLVIPLNSMSGNPAESETFLKHLQEFVEPEQPLSACFTTSRGNPDASRAQQESLCQWLEAQQFPAPDLYAVLEMTHKGRLEIHCFGDALHQYEIPLTMHEDGTLYQQTSNY